MMLTIDTNVLVRMLVQIDPGQGAIVRRLAAANTLMILCSVLLETEWILRSIVKADAQSINAMFRVLLKTQGVIVDNSDNVRRVLDLHQAGMDFADAMHLCLSDEATTFVTFDRDLVRRARRSLPSASVELADTL
ncbi:type II toxin-antitoxin system VapC family toxin [Rhizobium sp. DKSPLA3]|uniref:Type II toxin-antitoxin system VapC family toxin n=1 Tax=Rhizobium quercicola TaxID=2901226 RepID=A0A9X1NUP3_9HYPH|nr:type II toxin-antitoxin system VapC family toxin [Rhizobium quercicola]MCD7110813.1 type II toxin-antitoxin system VapC family toxin [Rhizobium quercicola]